MVEPRAARDLAWLMLALLALVATGIGFRDPWPADEPRFALIARDMLATGNWLFPQVGGDLYPDKPPVYFWLLAITQFLFGSVRAAFLIPSFLAACGITVLVYDLAARLFGRAAAWCAGLTLVCSLQFLLVTRGAQIDATLCFLTTLSLYALLRHLLLGPKWGWYCIGAAAAGLGVVTKGVGFLPLLVLVPWFVCRRMAAPLLPAINGGWRWLMAIPAFVLGTAVWLVPMLVAVALHPTPARLAYRNEILFHQTVGRYSAAWHHLEPWYYFLLNVIPGLWLPVSVLVIWLAPRWLRDWRARDPRVLIPLVWVILVTAFFSASAGKRGIYVFPAFPAAILAAAPHLPELFRLRSVQRTGLVLAGLLLLIGLATATASFVQPVRLGMLLSELPGDIGFRLLFFVVAGFAAWTYAFRKEPILAWPLTLGILAITWSFLIEPKIDSERSARGFMAKVEAQVSSDSDLGLLAYKEQFLLQSHRRTWNFGHARWREQGSEVDDAARWLNDPGQRRLLVPADLLSPCFSSSPRDLIGDSGGGEWWLVRSPADLACAARGDPQHVFDYQLSSLEP